MWLLFFVIFTCVSADVSKTRVYNRKGSTSAKLPYPSLNCEHVLQNASLGASYYCPKGRKLGPDLLSCVDLDECAEWGCCDQLCENTIGSFKCSCGPGYSMLKDTYTCVADNSSALLLYFAYDNTVFSMDSFGRNITVVTNTTQIAGFDYHYTKKVFYWSDIYTKRINIQSMDPNSQISIPDDNKFLPNTWAPTAIAVDWIGNNLYVIDSFGRNIDLLDLQGHWRGTVLGNNVTIPSDIALDPTLGYMFIVDVVQILRANMDGTNLVTIVRNNYIINGVTVDTIAKRIYWFDFSLDCITTTDYDGRKKILVVCGQKIPYNTSLTVFENKLYWTEDTNKRIMSVNIFDNSSINSIYSTEDIKNLTTIKAYHPAVQSHIDNPCRSNNSGCQQICVLTNFKSSLGSRCACNMGWKLKSDERTCEIVTEFLLYSNKGFVKATVLDPIVDSLTDVFLPVASKGVLTLDFDAKDQQIYYTDVENGIYRNHINGTQKETVLAYKRSVEGLAVDWISKNIYYIDAREYSLNILSIRNFTYQRTFLKNLKRPRGIAVHPNKGYVFFSEWWSPGNISRVLSDGSNLTVFKNLSLGWPNGLAIDFATDRLYWCDTRLQQVQHSTFDGTDVKTITSKLIKMPFNIVIYNDFMYTTDWKLKTITKHHKLTGESAEILSTFSRIPFGIKVYSEKEQQIIPNHPCWNNNGGCQKFCLAVPVDQNICLIAKCACPQGERLNDDEKTCRVDSNDMMLVREQPNSYFSCRNNRCIPKAWVCDGYDDCLDNSDELDCRTNLSCTTPNCEDKCQESPTGDSCYCHHGKKLAPDNQTCVDIDECAEWGSCDQLCENTVGSFKCSCAPGYSMASDTNRCIADNSSALLLFFAHDNVIVSFDPLTNNTKVVANSTEIGGFDYHYATNTLYWTDVRNRTIYATPISPNSKSFGTAVNISLLYTRIPSVIAVDWIGNKLYVVDTVYKKIDIFDLQGQWNATVLGNNLNDPTDLVLDPTIGYMFVADSDQVLRANMDGTNTVSIITDERYKTSGITVDIISKRLYWWNYISNYITTVDYDGQKRFVVVREEQIPDTVGLAIFENKIYWTDDTNKRIMSVDKFDNTTIHSIYNLTNIKNLKTIKAYHPAVQPHIDNPCGNNNGGCQQMCVLTNFKSSLGYRCACNMGWQLASDKLSCELVTDFLMYSLKIFLQGKVLNAVTEGFDIAMPPTHSYKTLALDFDGRDQYIYYGEKMAGAILRVHRNGTKNEVVTGSPTDVGEGLAIDWAGKNLYTVNDRQGLLNVLSTRNFTYRKTLLKNLHKPSGIVVHPNRGYVFFSEWDKPVQISRIMSDGSNLVVFRNLNLGCPTGLAIDFAMDRLYWCDSLLLHVQHSTFDGTDVKTITSKLIQHPYSIAIYNDFMYISDWNLRAVMKLHKYNAEFGEPFINVSQSDGPFGLKVYSTREQRIIPTHPCSNNNGGCQKFCFAVPGNSNTLIAKCGCPTGERLHNDNKICEADPNYKKPIQTCPINREFMCRNERCVPIYFVCDGQDNCLDNSDELNCPITCDSSRHFRCNNGRCIPKKSVCDDVHDCPDRSDEANCTKQCPYGFRCSYTHACLWKFMVCDGHNDCVDNEDEKDCSDGCPSNQFKCADMKQCVDKSSRCDGKTDCNDRSDEFNCEF